MKAMQKNLNEWLREEAHVIAGPPFQMGECSCLPVAHDSPKEEVSPVGFLVTHGNDVAYVPAQTPDGEQMVLAWNRQHALELEEESSALPSEYWYG